jgi:hypothetical protein
MVRICFCFACRFKERSPRNRQVSISPTAYFLRGVGSPAAAPRAAGLAPLALIMALSPITVLLISAALS